MVDLRKPRSNFYIILVFLTLIDICSLAFGKEGNKRKEDVVLHSDIGEDAKRLVEYLLAPHTYNLLTPTFKSRIQNSTEKHFVPIYFGVSLHYISRLDPWNHLLTSIKLHQTWEDTRLRWNSTDYANITILSIPYSRIWKPITIMDDNLEADFQPEESTPITVKSSGLLRWDRFTMTKTICKQVYAFFPFDIQECFLTFTFRNPEIELFLMNLNFADIVGNMRESKVWKVLNATLELVNPSYIHGLYPILPRMSLRVTLQRNPFNNFLSLIAPTIALSTLIPFSFMTPFKQKGRLFLNLTILALLIFTSKYWSSNLLLPLVESYYGKYLLLSIALALISVLQTLFGKNQKEAGGNSMKPSRNDRLLFWISSIFLLVLNVVIVAMNFYNRL